MPVVEQPESQEVTDPPTLGQAPPGLRGQMMDPSLWRDTLEKYARATSLAVALADAEGRLLGECINPQRLWSLLRAQQPSNGACPFELVLSHESCTCVAAAFRQGRPVVAHGRGGLAHVAVPLVLRGEPLGALLAGQVFDQYPEQLPLEQLAKKFGIAPQAVWQLARLEHPVKENVLRVYADLLMTLGNTFLQTRYDEVREAARLAEMTRLRDRAVTEIVERQRAESALQRSELQFHSLLEKLPAGAYTCDAEGMITYFNQQAAQLWGRIPKLNDPDDRFCGSFKLYSPDGAPIPHDQCWMALALKTEREHNGREIVIERPDGRRFTVLAYINPIRDEAGTLLGAVNVVVDITQRKQAAEELRRSEEQLKEADRRKTEFLGMLAHELRNPLAPIRNALQVLRLTGNNVEGVRAASEMMERQVGQMVLLVDDLLDVSRISRGKIELRRGRVELASVVHHSVEAARPALDSAKHELTITMPLQPVYLDADPTRLAQVVGNLLNNACKFTDKGGHIWLTVERDGGRAVIRVRDSGIGIAADQLPRVFDLFMQVDTSLERSVSGLGIGLALVKTLVEMHGGTVEVHSAGVGQGSEFVVCLPVLGETANPPPEPSESKPTPMTSCRVLVVDDNRDSATSLAMLLQLTGNETHTAYDGEEAVEAAATFRPDVVLLDIGLPKLNGYEAGRKIRKQPWSKGMVLVALTGWGQEEDRQRSREAGFDGHLVKPVDLAALEKLLAELGGAGGNRGGGR